MRAPLAAKWLLNACDAARAALGFAWGATAYGRWRVSRRSAQTYNPDSGGGRICTGVMLIGGELAL